MFAKSDTLFLNPKHYNWILSVYTLCCTFILFVQLYLIIASEINNYTVYLSASVPLIGVVIASITTIIYTYIYIYKKLKDKIMALHDQNAYLNLANNIFIHFTTFMATFFLSIFILFLHSGLMLVISRYPYIAIIPMLFLVYINIKRK